MPGQLILPSSSDEESISIDSLSPVLGGGMNSPLFSVSPGGFSPRHLLMNEELNTAMYDFLNGNHHKASPKKVFEQSVEELSSSVEEKSTSDKQEEQKSPGVLASSDHKEAEKKSPVVAPQPNPAERPNSEPESVLKHKSDTIEELLLEEKNKQSKRISDEKTTVTSLSSFQSKSAPTTTSEVVQPAADNIMSQMPKKRASQANFQDDQPKKKKAGALAYGAGRIPPVGTHGLDKFPRTLKGRISGKDDSALNQISQVPASSSGKWFNSKEQLNVRFRAHDNDGHIDDHVKAQVLSEEALNRREQRARGVQKTIPASRSHPLQPPVTIPKGKKAKAPEYPPDQRPSISHMFESNRQPRQWASPVAEGFIKRGVHVPRKTMSVLKEYDFSEEAVNARTYFLKKEEDNLNFLKDINETIFEEIISEESRSHERISEEIFEDSKSNNSDNSEDNSSSNSSSTKTTSSREEKVRNILKIPDFIAEELKLVDEVTMKVNDDNNSSIFPDKIDFNFYNTWQLIDDMDANKDLLKEVKNYLKFYNHDNQDHGGRAEKC